MTIEKVLERARSLTVRDWTTLGVAALIVASLVAILTWAILEWGFWFTLGVVGVLLLFLGGMVLVNVIASGTGELRKREPERMLGGRL